MNKGVYLPQGSTSGLRELLPVGTPLANAPPNSFPLNLAILEDNIEFIHLIIVLLTLFERKTFKRESGCIVKCSFEEYAKSIFLII